MRNVLECTKSRVFSILGPLCSQNNTGKLHCAL